MLVNSKTTIKGDFHCHTLASMHAYSTLHENIEAARRQKLCLLAITDHGIGNPDSPPLSFFENLVSLPQSVDGIRILRGIEANIMDHEGHLDIPDEVLQQLDFVVASYHLTCAAPDTALAHTRSYIQLAQNPHVHLIGHSGSAEFPYEYETVIPIFGACGKVVEINAHTFMCRKKSIDNCRRIAELCAKHNVPVMVNSDAHSEFEVGHVERALAMLSEIGFPEHLILNADEARIEAYLRSK